MRNLIKLFEEYIPVAKEPSPFKIPKLALVCPLKEERDEMEINETSADQSTE